MDSRKKEETKCSKGGGVIGRRKQTSEIKGVKCNKKKPAGELKSQESRLSDDDGKEQWK